MWISRYVTGHSFPADKPGVGEVRAAGAKVTVSASADHTGVPTAAPYGIVSVPPVGSRSLILPTDGGCVCLGVIGAQAAELEQGELMLCSSGGASIVLKNDGRVLINGRAVE
jgi:phage gp45-like